LFSTAAASLWLSISGYAAVHQLASGSALFAPFEWLWYAGTAVLPLAFLSWFLGLLVLGVAASLEGRLPRRLRVLPLALFALIVPSYVFGGWFEMVGNPVVSVIVMGFAQGLPFVGVAILGWALLRDYDAEPLVVSSGPAERTAGGARSGTSGVERDKEKELLRAIRRHGQLTVTGVALETSLSVEQAERMLSELASKGHLEVRVEHGRLFYSLWEDRG